MTGEDRPHKPDRLSGEPLTVDIVSRCRFLGGIAGEPGPEPDAGAKARPCAVLEVRDHGPGLPPEEAGKVFQRFYRVDSSRRRGTGGGSGLGLSIVSAVTAAHGGSVDVRTTPGGGATFRIALPLAHDLPYPDDLAQVHDLAQRREA